jgi:hypothetical protein
MLVAAERWQTYTADPERTRSRAPAVSVLTS